MSPTDFQQKLEYWSCAAAQELQETLEASAESGCDQPGIRALLEEHDAIMRERQ